VSDNPEVGVWIPLSGRTGVLTEGNETTLLLVVHWLSTLTAGWSNRSQVTVEPVVRRRSRLVAPARRNAEA
jgi:hypothetical protein